FVGGNATIQHGFPQTITLLLPNRQVLPKCDWLIVRPVRTKLPRTSCVTDIASARDVRERRLPTQQPFARLTRGPIFLSVDRRRLKNNSILRKKLEERVARPFGRRGLREGVLHLNQNATIL